MPIDLKIQVGEFTAEINEKEYRHATIERTRQPVLGERSGKGERRKQEDVPQSLGDQGESAERAPPTSPCVGRLEHEKVDGKHENEDLRQVKDPRPLLPIEALFPVDE